MEWKDDGRMETMNRTTENKKETPIMENKSFKQKMCQL